MKHSASDQVDFSPEQPLSKLSAIAVGRYLQLACLTFVLVGCNQGGGPDEGSKTAAASQASQDHSTGSDITTGSQARSCLSATASGVGSTIDAAVDSAIANALRNCAGSLIDTQTRFEKRTEIRDGIEKTVKSLDETINEFSAGVIRKVEIVNSSGRDGAYSATVSVTFGDKEVERFFADMVSAESAVSIEAVRAVEANRKNRRELGPIIEGLVFEPLGSGEAFVVKIGEVTEVSDIGLMRRLGSLDRNSVVSVSVKIELDQNFLKSVESLFTEIAAEAMVFDRASRSLTAKRGGLVFGLGSFGAENTVEVPIKPVSLPVSGFKRFYVDWARGMGRTALDGTPKYYLFGENSFAACSYLKSSAVLKKASEKRLFFDFQDRMGNAIFSQSWLSLPRHSEAVGSGTELVAYLRDSSAEKVTTVQVDFSSPVYVDFSADGTSCFIGLNQSNEFFVAFSIPPDLFVRSQKVVAYLQ